MNDEAAVGKITDEAVQAAIMEKLRYAVQRHAADVKVMKGTVLVSQVGPPMQGGSRIVLVEFRLEMVQRQLIARPKLTTV